MNKNQYDVLIIGGGPAGLSAAIYAARAELKTGLIEFSAPGGKLINTHNLENYPGIDSGLTGGDVAVKFFLQSQNMGAEYIAEKVVKIDNLKSFANKIVELENGEKLETKTIIIASGTTPIPLDVPGYWKYYSKGVSNCVVCDGALHKGQDIALIGGGNAATEESLFGAGFAKTVYVINEYPSFISEGVTMKKIRDTKNINLMVDSKVLEIKGDDEKVTGIVIKTKEGIKEIPLTGVFTYVGFTPASKFLENTKITDKKGFIDVDLKTAETKVDGVFAAGDILNKPFKQVTGATSDGTHAALAAKKYIDLNS
ncbi:MAG: FAD-dependent oxidoreductase [Mycoplasmataceae bacterium]|nr:FAD-dependent oxidoreductase [Mycoplasmataceae bacterium]